MFVDNYIPTIGSDYSGGILNHFVGRQFDAGYRRPFIGDDERKYVRILTGRYTTEKGEKKPIRESIPLRNAILEGIVPPTFNATALRKEEWIQFDTAVLRAARYRLRAWADLSAANTFGGFNGMSKLILEYETMSDPGEAVVDMNGLTDGRGDAPNFQLQGLPLPITHSDFWFDARTLAASRNSGTPLDTTMGESAGRRVAESIEKQLIGNVPGIIFGGASTQIGGYGRTSKVYGYTTFPSRLTRGITAPTHAGWSPQQTQIDINACLLQLRNAKFYGPFMIYHSTDWDTALDGDYFVSITSGAVAPTTTLRNRLKQIDGVLDIRRLDFLFASTTDQSAGGPGLSDISTAYPFTLLIIQMTPDVARAVNGMDITTVQWESVGGMRVNFKVMAIQVPQIRADYYGNCGILQATGT